MRRFAGDPTRLYVMVGAIILVLGTIVAFSSWRTAEAMTDKISDIGNTSYESRIRLSIAGLILGGFGAGVLVSGIASGMRPEFRHMSYCPFCGYEKTSVKTLCPRCGKNLRF